MFVFPACHVYAVHASELNGQVTEECGGHSSCGCSQLRTPAALRLEVALPLGVCVIEQGGCSPDRGNGVHVGCVTGSGPPPIRDSSHSRPETRECECV
jgi:hypothetical protein